MPAPRASPESWGRGQLKFSLPQLAQFLAGFEQGIERALCLNPAFFQDDDLIGAAERRPPMRYDQTGHARLCENTFPQLVFRFHVKCTG